MADDGVQVVVGAVVPLVAHVGLDLLALAAAPPATRSRRLAPDGAALDARVAILEVIGTLGVGLVEKSLQL